MGAGPGALPLAGPGQSPGLSSSLMSRLASGETLSSDEAEAVFGVILDGHAGSVALAGLLMALRVRGETEAELAGAVAALRARMVRVAVAPGAIDVCGTGGDAAGTLNISTAVALVVAGCGVVVAKHGNRAVSSRSGAADVLAALGVGLVGPERVAGVLARAGVGFLFAPAHHAGMAHAAEARRALGTRTIFNLLGPLANPAGGDAAARGGVCPAVAAAGGRGAGAAGGGAGVGGARAGAGRADAGGADGGGGVARRRGPRVRGAAGGGGAGPCPAVGDRGGGCGGERGGAAGSAGGAAGGVPGHGAAERGGGAGGGGAGGGVARSGGGGGGGDRRRGGRWERWRRCGGRRRRKEGQGLCPWTPPKARLWKPRRRLSFGGRRDAGRWRRTGLCDGFTKGSALWRVRAEPDLACCFRG